MLAALEWAATHLQADMLRFVALSGSPWPFELPPLRRLLLARATALAALMPSAVELGFADAKAVRMLDVALVTGRFCRCPPAAAGYIDGLRAGCARAGMALVRAQMATSQNLIARLVAVRNGILTRPSWLQRHGIKARLAAWTVCDNVRGEGAVGGHFILRVA